MKNEVVRYIGMFLLVCALLMGATYSFGWFGVGYTKTVGKAKQNADREVYEETSSFTKGKRQEILKYYKEYMSAETLEEKEAIEVVVRMSLADFDEDRFITEPKLLHWVKRMKY